MFLIQPTTVSVKTERGAAITGTGGEKPVNVHRMLHGGLFWQHARVGGEVQTDH